MSSSYERSLIVGWLANFAKRTRYSPKVAWHLLDWLTDHGSGFGLAVAVADGDEEARFPEISGRRLLLPSESSRRRHRSETSRPHWRAIRDFLDRQASRPSGTKDRAQLLVDALSRELRLDPVERDILGWFSRAARLEQFRDLMKELSNGAASKSATVLAGCLGLPERDIARRIDAGGSLIRAGVLARNGDDFDGTSIGTAHLTKRVSDLFTTCILRRRPIEYLLGPVQKTALSWEDFGHLGPARDIIARFLAGADRTGVNILLYGPPGSGKTEFAKVVARRIGRDLYSVAEEEDGHEPERTVRLAQYRLAQRLLGTTGKSLILFDEMEDLLDHVWGGGRLGGSKVFNNRILEANTVPTIWTCNEVSAFDPAFLRRMTFAAEIRVPPAKTRAAILHKALKEEGVTISSEQVLDIATRYSLPAAFAVNAAKVGRINGGDTGAVIMTLENMGRLVAGRAVPPVSASGRFDIALANTSVDLQSLAARLLASDQGRRSSFCLYGPPGTGKSLFARHVADRLELEIVHKRASDLFSKWVGGTEKNIAAAFAEAQAGKAFLIIDEADSLLRDRRLADRSWEVTQVNEMLTWMEAHPLPFAFTTNLVEDLDRAALRRFTFKIRFDYLTMPQRELAFRRFFGIAAPQSVLHVPNLTPADFALAARKASVLGNDAPQTLAKLVMEEAAAKEDAPRTIGFRL